MPIEILEELPDFPRGKYFAKRKEVIDALISGAPAVKVPLCEISSGKSSDVSSSLNLSMNAMLKRFYPSEKTSLRLSVQMPFCFFRLEGKNE